MIIYDSTRFRTNEYEEWSSKAKELGIESLNIILLKKTRKRLNQSNFFSERWFTNLLDRMEVHTGLRIKCCTNYPILNRYFADFYFKDLKFVVEIDGNSHAGKEAYDELRDRRISMAGLKVLRIRSMNESDFSMFESIFKSLLKKDHTDIPLRQSLQIVGLKKRKKNRRKNLVGRSLRAALKKNEYLCERKVSVSPRTIIRKKAI